MNALTLVVPAQPRPLAFISPRALLVTLRSRAILTPRRWWWWMLGW